MITLTPTQSRVLESVVAYMQECGYPPTTRELADRLGVKAPSVHEQLTRLEEKGYIRRDRLKARSIEILRTPRRVSSGRSPDDESARVPLLGEIAAGLPLLSEANFEGELEVSISRGLRPGNFFALRVKGDSMIECGIHPDDYVIVRQQTMAENGEIVAAIEAVEQKLQGGLVSGGNSIQQESADRSMLTAPVYSAKPEGGNNTKAPFDGPDKLAADNQQTANPAELGDNFKMFLKKESPLLGAKIVSAESINFADGTLTLSFPKGYIFLEN
ncbi:MAG: repressor LexA, partial [Deltaproteobacteria bacterium HGW-Deltaproteobacteria-17]